VSQNKDGSNTQDKNQDELLLDHNYDGIQELDNPLPFWWLAIFYITMVFAAGYVFYYEFGDGPTLNQELAEEQKVIENIQYEGPSGPAGLDEAKLSGVIADSAQVELGKGIFAGKCAACHGPEGQGVIGPNLADAFWINGDGSPMAVAKVIQNGVGDKGMPAWGTQLKEEELYQVAAYVTSLKGTNPANPKAPQGNRVNE